MLNIIEAEMEVIQNVEKIFVLESTPEALQTFYNELEKFISTKFADSEKLMIGFYEIVANAVEHGNKFNPAKKVHIQMLCTENFLYFSVEDEGEGFNWKEFMKKNIDYSNFEERGRGIIITKMCYDYFCYNKKGNKASLLKLF